MWILVNIGFERPFHVGAILRPSKEADEDLRLATVLGNVLNNTFPADKLEGMRDSEIKQQVRKIISQSAGDNLSPQAIARAEISIRRWPAIPRLGQPVPDGVAEILSQMPEVQRERVKWDMINAAYAQGELDNATDKQVTALGFLLNRFLKNPKRYQCIPGVESVEVTGKALPHRYVC